MFAVQNNTELQRYEFFEAGSFMGFVQYQMHHEQMWVLFTQMRRKFKSAARANRAMAFILEDARRRRIHVVPFCPAFRVFMCQNPSNPVMIPYEWQQRIAKAVDEEQDDASMAVLKYIRYTGSPWRKPSATPTTTLTAGIGENYRDLDDGDGGILDLRAPEPAGEPPDPEEQPPSRQTAA